MIDLLKNLCGVCHRDFFVLFIKSGLYQTKQKNVSTGFDIFL